MTMHTTNNNHSSRSYQAASRESWHSLLVVLGFVATFAALPLWGDSEGLAGSPASPPADAAMEHPGSETSTPEGLARVAAAELDQRDYAHAIATYHRVLDLRPSDYDAQFGLARSLAYSGQYDAALRRYQMLLQAHPDDADVLEAWSRATVWAGRPSAALPTMQKLVARFPANPSYTMALARLEMKVGQYAQARERLKAFLAAHPHQHEAQIQLAYLDIYEGRYADGFREFNRLIAQDPTDAEALLGNARVAYYRGDLKYARDLTAKIFDDNPDNSEAVLLLANLERAMHNGSRARNLLNRAKALNPNDAEVRDLESHLRQDVQPTFHTSVGFAREIASGFAFTSESLSSAISEATWGFAGLPRSESQVTLAYLPSQSPYGATRGAAGPSAFLYRQTTYVLPELTLRSGWGVTRYGPGGLAAIPNQDEPISSAQTRPTAFGDLSYVYRKKLTFDFLAGRTAVTCTPTAVRLGVMENRYSAALTYQLGAKTNVHLERFVGEFSSIAYRHDLGFGMTGSPRPDRDHSQGTSLSVDRQLFHRRTSSASIGYAGLTYGFTGQIKPYLGMFSPRYYQRQYATTHVAGRIHGPLGYDFSGGAGVQQVERNTPTRSALTASPAFVFRASPRLALTLGYTYYDNSQSLGVLRGDAVHLSADWKL